MVCRSLSLTLPRSLALVLSATLVISLGAVGCTSGRRGGTRPVDSGPRPGDGRATDSGSIIVRDSGTTTPDTGTTEPVCSSARPCPTGQTCIEGTCRTPTTECDAARPCPGGEVCDSSGMCVMGETCGPMVVPAPTTRACARSTESCVMGATSQADFNACLAADPNTMACDACLQEAQASCATMNGCDGEFGDLNCCITDAGCTDSACVDTYCRAESDGYVACARGLGATCDVVSVVVAACAL